MKFCSAGNLLLPPCCFSNSPNAVQPSSIEGIEVDRLEAQFMFRPLVTADFPPKFPFLLRIESFDTCRLFSFSLFSLKPFFLSPFRLSRPSSSTRINHTRYRIALRDESYRGEMTRGSISSSRFNRNTFLLSASPFSFGVGDPFEIRKLLSEN